MPELNWIREIKAIGWDLDGTLYKPGSIPSEVIDRAKLRKVSERNGWTEEKSRKEFARLYSQLNSNTKTLTALGVEGEEFFTGVWDELALQNYIKTDKKVDETIVGLNEKGLRQFVLSNSNREDQIETKLRLVGVDPERFEFLVATVGLGAVKPDAKPFLEALRLLNQGTSGSNPEVEAGNVLYVGDRDRTDIMGAKNVGMRACMVWGRSELADASSPNGV